MKKFTILVDMDDTLINLLSSWVEWLNKQYGTNVEAKNIESWNVDEFFPTIQKKDVYSPLYKNSFWRTVKPKEDAIKYLKLLFKDGHDVYVATNSNYETLKIKMKYVLFRYFPFITWEKVIVLKNKSLLRADYLIDDAPHNLVGGSYKKILINMPHNKDFNENGIFRVSNWKEIYEIIKKDSEN